MRSLVRVGNTNFGIDYERVVFFEEHDGYIKFHLDNGKEITFNYAPFVGTDEGIGKTISQIGTIEREWRLATGRYINVEGKFVDKSDQEWR